MDETDQLSDEQLWARLAGAEPAERAHITLELAERAAGQHDHERTVTLGKAAAAAAESSASTHVQADATFVVADAHAALGRTEDALMAYADAAGIYRGLLDEREVAICHFRAGWALSEAERVEESLGEWRTAEGLLSGLDDCHDDLGKCALARAGAFKRLGRLEESLDAVGVAREAFRRHGDPVQTTWADDRAASVLLGLGRSSEAVERLELSLSVAEAVGEAERLAYARLRLAHALRVDGRHHDALPVIRRARQAFRAQGYLADVAHCDREAAICLAWVGKHDKAHRRFVRSRAVSDAAGDDAAVRSTDLDISVLLWRVGRTEESIEAMSRALESARDADDHGAAFRLTSRLANCLLDLDRADEAAQAMERCPSMPTTTILLERALHLGARARLAVVGGDEEAATALLDEGLRRLDGTSLTSVQAKLYAVRAEATVTSDSASSAADRARAVALYLADGDSERAEELSRPFLPASAT